ncbi:macro domain-containing protein CT2219-like isoform X2 [Brevipalpus obovatus]
MSSSEKELYLSMSLEEKRKEYSIKGKPVTLDQVATWPAYAVAQNFPPKSTDSREFSVNGDHNQRISIFRGDITSLEIDCIVNAANKELQGGGGVDGAIHRAAGHNLLQSECRKLGGCDVGDAKITGGYRLPARYIIHTVGPVGEKPDKLRSCYKRCLEVMKENQLKSIAFPCVSTGIYHYPNDAAADVVLSTVREWMDRDSYSKEVERIIFCLFMDEDVKCYHRLLPKYFPLE